MLTLLLLTAIFAEPEPKPNEPFPKNFVEYFVRADANKAGWIKKTEKSIELNKIGINSVEAKEKVQLKSKLAMHEEELKSFKKMKPIIGIQPLEEGSIGVFEDGEVIGVVDKNTIVARGRVGGSTYFAVLKMKSTRGITTKSPIGISSIKDAWKEKPDIWIVSNLKGTDDAKVVTLLRASRSRQAVVPILEIIDPQLLDKYRSAYDEQNKAKPEPPEVPDKPVAMEPVPDEFRTYFERADATAAELVSGIEKKIAGLEKAIGDIDTLPVDKKRMEQELTLARAKLGSSNRAKPFAYLRNNPVIGDLGTLKAARVAAIHDPESVVASVADIYGARLTEVDAKSLKMKVGVAIDESAVWRVVAVDEKPIAEVADSLKAKKLVVVKPVDKNELEKHRAAYEAATKPSPVTPAQ